MQGVHLRKYGVEAKIDFVLYEVDGVDFRTDWTPAAGDVFMMRDEGDEEQVTNAVGNADLKTLVTDEGRGYSITLALEDLQAKRVEIFFVDQATKVFLDWSIIIETYGHASAQHAFDLDAASVTTDSASRTASKATGFAVANDVTTAHSTTDGLLATIAGYLDTEIAAIKAVTDALPNSGALSDIATNAARLTAVRAAVLTDWINDGRLDVLLDAVNTVVPDAAGTAPTTAQIKTAIEVGGSSLAQILAAVKTNAAGTDIAADIIALKTVADAIKVVTDLLADSATTLISGTVSYDNTNATTTVFYCDDITEATADHYQGREVIFLTAALFRQATDITAYALVSGEGKFTVTALTEPPPDNCTFVIV